MGTELLIPQENQVALVSHDPKDILTGLTYNSRVQLFQAISNEVVDGKIGVGRFGVVKDKAIEHDLGKSFNAVIIAMRAFAIDFRDPKKIATFTDPKSEGYKAILEIAMRPGKQGCMAGPQFLLYMADFKEYMELGCFNKTFRREANNIFTLQGYRVTFTSNKIEAGGNIWFGPKVTKCMEEFETPPVEQMKAVGMKFISSVKEDAEKVAEEETRER